MVCYGISGVVNCPPEPRPHVFMFAHWSVMRERSIQALSVNKGVFAMSRNLARKRKG